MKARKAAMDTDGDGQISEEERKAARKQRMLKRLDTDGDGEISEEERKAAKAKREKSGE
jgi:Ca2+-binding EF-hand superfamily protein